MPACTVQDGYGGRIAYSESGQPSSSGSSTRVLAHPSAAAATLTPVDSVSEATSSQQDRYIMYNGIDLLDPNIKLTRGDVVMFDIARKAGQQDVHAVNVRLHQRAAPQESRQHGVILNLKDGYGFIRSSSKCLLASTVLQACAMCCTTLDAC